MRGPSEGLHGGPALGSGGRGKGATPQPMAGPRGRDCHAAPPPLRPSGGVARGPEAPPHSPPPSHSGPRAGGGAAPPAPPPPHPPQLGSHRRGPPPPTRWGERRLDLLPRAYTGVPEQRAQRNSMEAAPHMTLP